MSVERALTAFAGFMVLLSVFLTIYVNEYFILFTAFIGANLFQQSFTGFCPATLVMRKLFGLKTEKELARQKH
ncbi:DUF2892 domain-containing protein [Aestuariibacter sp. A3R04]|uniref:YgaP family membrane protein n=1 Tax=Aestuariibacter sp. A3R04 TaxID=2841571 RepID=UPI001C082132|nr:DUF2892 domain-containing protein [Aestuariibacter sp. A3R04]MBU3020589.1 DUF2892 domain-containing protein [Aestuariibacter sp. A3R04]